MSIFLTPLDDIQLLTNGYEPIAVAGKAPVAECWETGAIDAPRIAAMREAYPHAKNTGLRTGRLASVDIDIYNQEHVALVSSLADKILGATPLRRFGSKGLMLCYQNENPIRKISVTTRADDGTKVEVLGSGLQFVAFGMHPTTNTEFKWIGQDAFDEIATPLTTPIESLPVVTPEALKQFTHECSNLLSKLGYPGVKVREAVSIERQKREDDTEENSAVNVGRAKEHLNNCVARGRVAVIGSLGNDTIYEIACELLDRFYLSQDKVEELMLSIWYPHCVPNTLVDECRAIISHAAEYMQNEPGARALPPASGLFREALDKLPDMTPPGVSDLGDAQTIKFEDENFDNNDEPVSANDYIGREFPPLRELIPVWCERNINTFLEGPAATQKSRSALQDAICLSVGLPVMGKEVIEPCECIYLNYENSPEEMARRIHMICKYLQPDSKADPVSPKGVHIWELRQNPRPIITVSKEKGMMITKFGRRFLSMIATRRNKGLHTLVVFDGLMDAIALHDNTRNDDTIALALIRLIDSWCMEYDFTAYSIVHPSRSSERGNTVGSYATAWTTKPRAIQTFKRVLSPFAGGGPKAKITEDTPIEDIFYQRRVQKRSNGPEGERIQLEYWKGGLRPHRPARTAKVTVVQEQPATIDMEDDEEF